MLRVGVDIGGTHTDLVLIDDRRRRITVHKAPTTVDDPSRGAVAAFAELCGLAGVEPEAVDYFMHGTTVATNIALEHKGAKVGLITTHGFRDVLHIARHKRPQTFSLQLDLPWQKHPLVPRRWRIGVPERIAASGEILTPLDEDAVRDAVRKLVAAGVEAIAVCFLFSFVDPRHERRAGEIVAEEAPGLFVSLSHVVCPRYREYERFSTTALNAYVGPKTSAYLERLGARLAEGGMKAGLHLMQSSGGAATQRMAGQQPVSLLMSGPAGGLLGGVWVGRSAGFSHVITLDVGGTSADIGIAPGGEVLRKHLLDTRLGDYHAMVPMAEVDAIGAGGGSVAYIDSGGQFQVGPRSAGADPGPCCYGRGGVEPTATDCLVSLGLIDPDNFLGGRMRLDAGLAAAAVEQRLARPLGCGREQAALGAIRILTHAMVQSIELNSVRRGYDPRDFALVAFGGGGPLFACDIARELSIPTVIIPPSPGLTSALGLLATDVAYERSRTVMQNLAAPDRTVLRRAFAEIERELKAQLRADGFAPKDMRLTRFADCRYRGQGYELRAEAKAGAVDAAFAAALRKSFDDAHAKAYNHASPHKEVVAVDVGVTAVGAMTPLRPQTVAKGGPRPVAAALSARKRAFFEVAGQPKAILTPRYRRELLRAGNRIAGPAIIDQMDTTTVLPPGFVARVDRHGNLIITVAKGNR